MPSVIYMSNEKEVNWVNADAFTDVDAEQAVDARLLDGSEASSSLMPDGAQLNLDAVYAYIPPDHMRIIVNIDTLISEVVFFFQFLQIYQFSFSPPTSNQIRLL